jgi:hypothetical protein
MSPVFGKQHFYSYKRIKMDKLLDYFSCLNITTKLAYD